MFLLLAVVMTLFSLAPHEDGLRLVEVEVLLVPGVPQLHLLGASESVARDLAPRIRTAAMSQGYLWPRTQQIVVNLRPSGVRAQSRGLDLPILLAVLHLTGQLNLSPDHAQKIFFGEVTLAGEVVAPQNLVQVVEEDILSRLVTGQGADRGVVLESVREFDDHGLKNLAPRVRRRWSRPPWHGLQVPESCAEFLKVAAVGEHHCLLAGPAGSGKTTVADLVHQLLADPSEDEWSEIEQWSQILGRTCDWRPKAVPHHSTPPLSVLGGGVPASPGEVTRAHRGVLILDEYLEFHQSVQEGLREPIESGEITISRRNLSRIFPAQFMLVATTNLCPCGELTPEARTAHRCPMSLARCRSHVDRLSGPMLDRFDLLVFTSSWRGKRVVPVESLLESIQTAQAFRRSRGQKSPNGRLSLDELERASPKWMTPIRESRDSISRRRWRAELRVARTFADLEGETELLPHHLAKAQRLTLKPFYQFRQMFA